MGVCMLLLKRRLLGRLTRSDRTRFSDVCCKVLWFGRLVGLSQSSSFLPWRVGPLASVYATQTWLAWAQTGWSIWRAQQHKPVSPTNLSDNKLTTHTMSSPCLQRFLSPPSAPFRSHHNTTMHLRCAVCLPRCRERQTSGNSPRGSRVFLRRVLRSDAMPRARSPDAWAGKCMRPAVEPQPP
jgi:hypothetical protein